MKKEDIIIVLAVLLFLSYIGLNIFYSIDCKLKGGTWFSREFKCIDVREIK